jgi:hypothetical protein
MLHLAKFSLLAHHLSQFWMQPSMMITKYFYCHPYMLPTIFIKIKISFTKFALAKKVKLHNFPSHLWHICKLCNSFFYMVENCTTFQKTKKNPCPQKEKQVSNVSSIHYFHHWSPVWGLCKNLEIGDETELGDGIGCGIGDDFMDNFNDPRKTLKYQFS